MLSCFFVTLPTKIDLANLSNATSFRFPFWGGFNAQKSRGEGYNH